MTVNENGEKQNKGHINRIDMIPAEFDMEIVPKIQSYVVSRVLADAVLLDGMVVVEVSKEWERN